MTSINNSSLSDDNSVTNDDTNDKFGMNFYYNNALSGATASYMDISVEVNHFHRKKEPC